MNKLKLQVATFFGIGNIGFAPGTFASMVTTIVIYLFAQLRSPTLVIQLLGISIVFLIGIPAASHAERHFNKKDPRHCVIDEVAGQMVGLLLVPNYIWAYIAGFFLFRFFDIKKPFPVNMAEKVPRGWGIMLDDIVAGIYTVLALHLGLQLLQLLKTH